MPSIPLTQHQETFIKQRVASGFYVTTTEVVAAALRLLEDEERLRSERLAGLKQTIAPALRQVKEGRVEDGESVIARVRAHIRAIPEAR